MMWEDWITSASTALDMDVWEAATFLSIIFTVALLGFVLLMTKGKHADITVPLFGMISFVLWIFLGWFPTWTGAVIAALFAFMLSRVIIKG
jgi:uncharacterized membrane protein YdjX (TVP38/TMEM64 family)